MIDLAREAARQLRRANIRVDWKATWQAFNDKHGGLPVRHAGRLLYEDGWMHALDYKGPEYPPPREPAELAKLKAIYQRGKLRALKVDLDWLEGIVGTYEEAQRLRSAPIQMATRTEDGWITQDLTESKEFTELRRRLAWTRDELARTEALMAETAGAARASSPSPVR